MKATIMAAVGPLTLFPSVCGWYSEHGEISIDPRIVDGCGGDACVSHDLYPAIECAEGVLGS